MTTLRPLADGVWLFPHDPDESKVQPAVGVVSDDTQTILIDSGNGLLHAQAISDALQQINAPPISHIIYTHHHWDHIFGACYFNVPTIAHVLGLEILRPRASKPWGKEYIDTTSRLDGSVLAMHAANPSWRNFKIVLPEITFDTRMTIPLNGFSLQLDHVGGYHARDSIVVRIKEARVMFLGDSHYPSPEVQHPNWHMLRGFLADSNYDIFVPGHEAPIMRRDRIQFFMTRIRARLNINLNS